MIKTNKKGITLIALVITIIILLLLAAVAIQLALGQNGLIVKSIQSGKEQAKSELLESAKLEYANLKAKDLENNSEDANFENILSSSNFLSKYDISGDNILKKNSNEIIFTKKELKDALGSEIPSSEVSEDDKYSTVIKLKVPNGTEEERTFGIVAETGSHYPIGFDLDFGNGRKVKEEFLSLGVTHKEIYNPGEYILKLKTHDYTHRT